MQKDNSIRYLRIVSLYKKMDGKLLNRVILLSGQLLVMMYLKNKNLQATRDCFLCSFLFLVFVPLCFSHFVLLSQLL